jgi:hypothetical protein
MLIGVYLRSSAAINDFFTASKGAVLTTARNLDGHGLAATYGLMAPDTLSFFSMREM